MAESESMSKITEKEEPQIAASAISKDQQDRNSDEETESKVHFVFYHSVEYSA